MTETANQLLSRVVPVCTWQAPGSTATTEPAYPHFLHVVREWRYFNRSVNNSICHTPGGQFQVFPNNAGDLLETLLGGASFSARCTGILGVPDFILCTNNPTAGKMPVEVKIRHNLRKKILSQAFGEMACNGLHFGILTNYSDTYFLKRLENELNNLYVSHVVHPDSTNPTLRDSKKRKSSSKQIGSRKREIASSSKEITTIGEYIDSGTFGKVFSGYYYGQLVAWKTCNAYKEQEATKMLKHEAHIYSILKECQGRAVSRLFYKGYIYDGYLFALVLQLIENAHHIDLERLTKEEKKLIINQLKSIHNCGVLHNDISKQNILYEPKSRHYFFIDFGLSEIVDNESPKLRKEERRLKRFLQL
ncbi:12036_t:CDS:2 [Funneliformis caledonium]|uniref:12036_t:CDS:1 n=1 Tax=Funneliformis caledonium TaxID=1117310 RepID=A0A9N9I197_9GLOM|nr:12036_t:CDS:2 [Funneliformis caledonium]